MARKRRGSGSGSRSKGSDAKVKPAAKTGGDDASKNDEAAKSEEEAKAKSEDATVVITETPAAADDATVVMTAEQVEAAADDVQDDAPTLKPASKATPKTGDKADEAEKARKEAAAKEAELDDLLFDQVTLAPQRRPTAQAEAQPAPFSAPPPRKPPPAADKKKDEEKGPLGVDVAILWRGDMLTARFFPKPVRVSVGPNGTFTMPEDVVGGPDKILIEPHGASRFGLRIDNEKAAGHLIVDGDVHDLSEVRQGNVSALKGPVVPLTAGTRAVLVFGDFTFIVSRVPVPPPRKFMLWSRDMVPFLLCLLFSAALTVGPLTVAHSFADLRGRARLSYKEKLDRRLAVLEFIEGKEEPPEELEEKEEEKKDEPPPLTPKEKEKIEEKQIQKKETELEKELKNLDEEKKDERIKALVDEAAKETKAIDSALAALDSQVGTRLFAEVDGDAGDSAVNPNGAGGGDVLADPEGHHW